MSLCIWSFVDFKLKSDKHNLLSQRPQKPMKRHYTCMKVRFGLKVMLSVHYRSLEVILRSLRGHFEKLNSNLKKCNRLGIQKNL